jgi:hypothetical protein
VATLFTPRANLFARGTLAGFILLLLGIAAFAYAYVRSPYNTGVYVDRPQPAPFSHQHHVSGLGLDCRYCHDTVEEQAFAGMPTTGTCMNCHWQLWTEAPVLEAVRASWARAEPLQWRRVHDLADFVYFDHAVHVSNGIGCSTCHGAVAQMPMMHKSRTLLMEWCLECHRHPHRYVRPKEEIFNTLWPEKTPPGVDGAALVEAYGINTAGLTDCSACHR